MLADIHIFNLWFVDEIKNAGINKAFEKFSLIVQAYNNLNKDLILTQSFIIQQVYQYLIIFFAAILQNNITKLYLWNIT